MFQGGGGGGSWENLFMWYANNKGADRAVWSATLLFATYIVQYLNLLNPKLQDSSWLLTFRANNPINVSNITTQYPIHVTKV